jgi:uncharacterized protein (UPF0335 family)
MDIFKQMGIGMAVATIKSILKKDANKRKFRNIILDVFKAIKLAYAGDPDFE